MGTNVKIGGGGFHHVAVKVHDFDASIHFYTDGLGFKEKLSWGEGDSRAVLLDTGDGNYLEVFAGGPKERRPEGAMLHVAFRTDNVDAAIEAARAAGAEITIEPKDVVLGGTPVRIAFCNGLDGEVIEFFQSAAL